MNAELMNTEGRLALKNQHRRRQAEGMVRMTAREIGKLWQEDHKPTHWEMREVIIEAVLNRAEALSRSGYVTTGPVKAAVEEYGIPYREFMSYVKAKDGAGG